MKRVFLAVIAILVLWGISYGASMLALTDNTLVTDKGMLTCLASNSTWKSLLMTAAAGTCSFAIIEDGVTVQTETVDTTTEKWVTQHTMGTFKVNWTAGTGTCTGATLQCWED
jgi:hypothetical protein